MAQKTSHLSSWLGAERVVVAATRWCASGGGDPRLYEYYYYYYYFKKEEKNILSTFLIAGAHSFSNKKKNRDLRQCLEALLSL